MYTTERRELTCQFIYFMMKFYSLAVSGFSGPGEPKSRERAFSNTFAGSLAVRNYGTAAVKMSADTIGPSMSRQSQSFSLVTAMTYNLVREMFEMFLVGNDSALHLGRMVHLGIVLAYGAQIGISHRLPQSQPSCQETLGLWKEAPIEADNQT